MCGDAALYFDPTSVTAIAAAIDRLAADAALRAQMRDLGRARASKFQWMSSARTLLATLSQGEGA